MILSNKFHSHKTFALLLLFVFFAPGCSSMNKGGSETTTEGEEGGVSESDLAKEAGRWNGGNIPRAEEGGVFENVHFGYDSAIIAPEDQEVVRRNADLLKKDISLHAELEGHCDKRGTAEYNMVLGEKRAKAVGAALVGLGVKPLQISTISYGAEIPLDPANTEDAYAKNRRAHFSVYRKETQPTLGRRY